MPILLEKPEPGRNARRGPRRLWTVPLAPALPTEPFDGFDLLEELGGDERPALFQSYRDTLLWALARPDERPNLFLALPGAPTTAAGPTFLNPAIEEFRKLVRDPGRVDVAGLARACTSVSEWAALSGYAATEYHFAVLAARVAPADPALAFNAGRAARRHVRIEDARVWFRRSVALARRADDEAAYASAFLGWGILEERQGNVDRAVQLFGRAWKAAKRGKLRELAAAARHNMIAIALAERNLARGQGHIIGAYKLYGEGNPQLHRLANDAAGFWFVFGFYSLSLPLYEAALPRFTRPDERAMVLANIGRAAAALGDRDRYLEARDLALDLHRELAGSLPEIYVELAHGAFTLGYTTRAKDLAKRAIQIARKHGDPSMVLQAESVLAAIDTGAEPDRPREPDPEMRRFAARFLARLGELA